MEDLKALRQRAQDELEKDHGMHFGSVAYFSDDLKSAGGSDADCYRTALRLGVITKAEYDAIEASIDPYFFNRAYNS
jgi:hypothetical protein